MTSHPHWRKASASASTAQCVEVADNGDTILVRDSKHPDQGHLTLTSTAISAFVHVAKTGRLDHLAH